MDADGDGSLDNDVISVSLNGTELSASDEFPYDSYAECSADDELAALGGQSYYSNWTSAMQSDLDEVLNALASHNNLMTSAGFVQSASLQDYVDAYNATNSTQLSNLSSALSSANSAAASAQSTADSDAQASASAQSALASAQSALASAQSALASASSDSASAQSALDAAQAALDAAGSDATAEANAYLAAEAVYNSALSALSAAQSNYAAACLLYTSPSPRD